MSSSKGTEHLKFHNLTLRPNRLHKFDPSAENGAGLDRSLPWGRLHAPQIISTCNEVSGRRRGKQIQRREKRERAKREGRREKRREKEKRENQR